MPKLLWIHHYDPIRMKSGLFFFIFIGILSESFNCLQFDNGSKTSNNMTIQDIFNKNESIITPKLAILNKSESATRVIPEEIVDIIKEHEYFKDIHVLMEYPLIVLEEAFRTMFFKNPDLKPLIILNAFRGELFPMFNDSLHTFGEISLNMFQLVLCPSENKSQEIINRFYSKLEPYIDKLELIMEQLNIQLAQYNEMGISSLLQKII